MRPASTRSPLRRELIPFSLSPAYGDFQPGEYRQYRQDAKDAKDRNTQNQTRYGLEENRSKWIKGPRLKVETQIDQGSGLEGRRLKSAKDLPSKGTDANRSRIPRWNARDIAR